MKADCTISLVFLFLLIGGHDLHAQNKIDSLYFEQMDSTKQIEEGAAVVDSIPYQATDFIHQSRYLPIGETFRTAHWWQKIFFGISSGLYGLTDKEWQSNNTPVTGFAGYEFNRVSGLRLSGTYVQLKRQESQWSLKSFGMDIDYLFHVSNYLNGYNPRRLLNLTLTPGFGFVSSSYKQHSTFNWKAQLGVHLGFQLGQTELFVEPYFGIADDAINQSDNPSGYDVLYGVRMGAAFRLRPNIHLEADTTYRLNRRPFMEFSQGLTLPLGVAVSGPHTWGSSYQLGAGLWLDPTVGLRMNANVQDYYWDATHQPSTMEGGMQVHPATTFYQRGMHFSARLEAMLNPLNASRAWRLQESTRWLDVNLSAGAEYGFFFKRGVEGTLGGMRTYYYGITTAIQMLLKVSAGAWLFVEPRFTALNYTIPYSNTDGGKGFTDKIGSLNVGIRLQRTPSTSPSSTHEMPRSLFREWLSRLTVSLQGGAQRSLYHYKTLGDAHLNPVTSIGAAYDLTPWSGARLRVEYAQVGFNQELDYLMTDLPTPLRYHAWWGRTSHLMTLKLGYLFNLTRLLMGHNHGRLKVHLDMGPLWSYNLHENLTLATGELPGGQHLRPITKDHSLGSSWGAYGGLLVRYELTPHWELLAQPELNAWGSDALLESTIFAHYNKWRLQLSIGTAYHF